MEAADKFFESNTFAVGERLSPVDLLLGQLLAEKEKQLAGFVNLTRYYKTVVNQPGYKTQQSASQAAPVCCVKPKAAEKKPEQPKQPEQSAADLLDQIEAAEKKPKDPFAVLPKGNFDFDDFKRKFSNFPENESIPYFWEKLDTEHYSIWLCDYKYNEELGLVFQSCNLVSGMYQRLDKMRKAAFASMCVFGEDNKNAIAGVWVWRGQGLAFELSEDWQVDYEVYSWKKLDPKDQETKKLVDVFFRREGTYKELAFNQGKIFK